MTKFITKKEKLRSYFAKSIIPLIDVFIFVARMTMLILHDRGVLKYHWFFDLGVLRLLRYTTMQTPQQYWLQSTLNPQQTKVINRVIEIVIFLLLMTNFFCCSWIFIGQKDYIKIDPNYTGTNSWLIVY